MRRQRDREIFRAVYDFQLALVANPMLTEDSWSKAQERANELKAEIIATLRPWDGRSFQERRKQEFKDYRQRYIDAFGVDPTDPQYKQWEADTIAQWMAEQPENETDEQRVTRLMLERDERRRQRRQGS